MIHLPGISIDNYLTGAGSTTRAAVKVTSIGTVNINTTIVDGGTVDGMSLGIGDRVLVREQSSSKEITDITTVADSGGSLGGKYYLIYSRSDPYYIWFDTGSSTDPNVVGHDSIPVNITTNDTSPTVAAKLQSAVNLIGDFSTNLVGSTLTVTDLLNGPVEDAVDGDTGFTISTTTQGTSNINSVIWEVTIGDPIKPADMDDGDSIAGVTIVVREGTIWEDSSWIVENDPPTDIIGTHEIIWAQSGSGSKIAATAIRTDSGVIDTLGGGTPAAGQNLFYDNGILGFQNSPQNILTVQGDIMYRDGSGITRLPIGPSGKLLVSDGTTTSWDSTATRVNLGYLDDTISTSYSIVESSAYYVGLTSSSGNDVVLLPDATTLSLGWEVFIINNEASTYTMDIKDNDSTFLVRLGINSDVILTLIDNGTTAGVWNINNRSPNNRVIVAKAGGDFISVKDAIDSITDASVSKRYIVFVTPGTYNESPITLKSYVYLIGYSAISTYITASVVTQPIITGVSNSGVGRLRIDGASGVGGIGISVDSISSFLIDSTIVSDCETLILGTASTADLDLVMRNNLITGAYTTGNHFDARAVTGSFEVNVLCFGGHHSGSTIVGSKANVFEGPNASIHYDGIILPGNNQGTAFEISDGAAAHVSNIHVSKFITAIDVLNVGAASIFDGTQLTVANCTNDFTNSHATTSGIVTGVFNIDKISNASDLMTFNILDSVNQKNIITGDLTVGSTIGNSTNVLDSIQAGGIGIITGGVLESGTGLLDIKPTKGLGYVIITEYDVSLTHKELRRVEWDGTAELTLGASTTNHIYIDSDGVLQTSLSEPDNMMNIILGTVRMNATTVEFIDQTKYQAHHINVILEHYSRNIFGTVYVSGSTVTGNASRELAVSNGIRYYGLNYFAPSGSSSPLGFIQYNHVASAWSTSAQTVVNNTQYDNGTALTALTAGYHTKHNLYTIGDGVDEKYFLVISDAEHATLELAQDAALSMTPPYQEGSIVCIASIIMQEGTTTIIEIVDERPVPGTGGGSGAASVSDHGLLTGLNDDDHLQYLLVNGSRDMSGGLNMGGFNITNVGTVDGIDVSAHGSRHLPNGTDALTTAAPLADITSTSTNAAGTANSFARSDHNHAIDGTIITTTGTQIETNKTITDTSNTISADLLRTATGNVDISASAAPTADQSLVATSATTATWQNSVYNILTTKGDLLSREASALVRIPIGINGDIPVADSVEAAGWKWTSPTATDSGVVSTVIWDEKTTGTNGGTFTSGAWQTRTLTNLSDTEGGIEGAPSASGLLLSSSQITIQEGTYFCIATATAYRVNGHQCRMQNITDATTLLHGSSQYAKNSSQGSAGSSQIFGTVSIPSTKILELQHYGLNTKSGTGYGVSSGIPGAPEIYSFIIFHKIRPTGY